MCRAGLIVLCVLLLVGSAAAFPVTITDALGRRVALAHPPQRIVSVAPSVTEVLFALSLADRIVGVSSADDYPAALVARKPRVGGVVLNVERIVGFRPDLVVGMPSLQRAQLDRLIAVGLPVVAVDAASLPGVYAQIALLGRVTGMTQRAERLLAMLRPKETAVREATRGRPARRVYVEIWGEPLIAAAGGTFITDLVVRAGGVNVFADLAGFPQVGAEAVIRRNPEVIVLTHPAPKPLGARPGWQGIAAVRTGRVTTVEGSVLSRPGPRALEGLEALARIIHPEAFR